MPEDFLEKRYVLEKSENFDEYMKELGVGLTLRKMGNTVNTECKMTRKDMTYTFTLKSPYRCSSIDFKLDIPFLEVTLDNRVVYTVCHLVGNVFTQEQAARGLKTTKIVREFKKDKLITTLTVGDVKAVRVYCVLEPKAEDSEKDPEVSEDKAEVLEEEPKVSEDAPE